MDPVVDVRRVPPAPEGFDPFVAWLGRLGDQLVLLEEYSLPDLRDAMETAARRIQRHIDASPAMAGWAEPDSPLTTVATLVRNDHRWFEVSLEELRGLVRVVEREDHGGHRQALGQYARLVAAALVRHRLDESEFGRLRRLRSPGVRER